MQVRELTTTKNWSFVLKKKKTRKEKRENQTNNYTNILLVCNLNQAPYIDI